MERLPTLRTKQAELEALFSAGKEFGIDCLGVFEIFLSVVMQNCDGLRLATESLFYATDSRILQIFGVGNHSARIRQEEAPNLTGKPQDLAERVYGLGNPAKAAALGNTQPGDGFKYRGRGYLRTTGRTTYRQLGQQIRLDLEEEPDRLAEPLIAARAAAALFVSQSRSHATVDVATAVRRLNGGFNGLSDARNWQEKITGSARLAPQGRQ